jgi:hypothetical protein
MRDLQFASLGKERNAANGMGSYPFAAQRKDPLEFAVLPPPVLADNQQGRQASGANNRFSEKEVSFPEKRPPGLV